VGREGREKAGARTLLAAMPRMIFIKVEEDVEEEEEKKRLV